MATGNERIGIPDDSFTDPVWHDVVRIYFQTTGYENVPTDRELEFGFYHTAEDALTNVDGYRFGSRLSMHSKLTLIGSRAVGSTSLVGFDFNPNADPSEIEMLKKYQRLTVDELTVGFRNGVDSYLQGVEGAQPFQR